MSSETPSRTLSGVCFSEEPRWVDLRWAKDEDQLDLQDPRFADAVADIGSALRGIPKDELASEEVRQHRRTVRTAWAGGVALAALAVLAGVLAMQSSNNAAEAERQAEVAAVSAARAEANAEAEAEARSLADVNARSAAESATQAEASAQLADERALDSLAQALASQALTGADFVPDTALLLAARAHRFRDNPATYRSLLDLLLRDLIAFRGVGAELASLTDGYVDSTVGRPYSIAAAASDGSVVAIGTANVLAFDPDLSFIEGVTLWDPGSWDRVGSVFEGGHRRFERPDSDFTNTSPYHPHDIRLSADGTALAYSNPAGAFVFEAGSGRELLGVSVPRSGNPAPLIDLTPDAKTLLVGYIDGEDSFRVETWDVGAVARTGDFVLGDEMGLAAFAVGEGRVVLVSRGAVQILDPSGLASAEYPLPAPATAVSLDASRERIALLTAGTAGLMVLSADTLEAVRPPLELPFAGGEHVSFSPRGSAILAMSGSGRSVVYDASSGELIADLVTGAGFPVGSVWMGETEFFTFSATASLRWDLAAEPSIRSTVGTGAISAVALGGDVVAFLESDKAVSFIRDGSIGRVELDCDDSPKDILSVDETGSTVLALCVGSSGALTLFFVDMSVGSAAEVEFAGQEVVSAILAADGSRAYVSTPFGELVEISLSGAAPQSVGYPGVFPSMARGSDSADLVAAGTATEGEDVIIVDSRTGERVRGYDVSAVDPYAETAPPTFSDVTVAPDGATAFAIREDRLIAEMPLNSPGEPPVLRSSQVTPASIAVSPGGRYIAVGGRYGRLEFWTMDGTRLGTYRVEAGAIMGLAWDDNGLWAVGDFGARLWSLNPTQLADRACELAGRDLSTDEWSQFVGDLQYEPTCPTLEEVRDG